jgi:L-alanine-DL-glutamate epimerase-like enolase superfamily enzyme
MQITRVWAIPMSDPVPAAPQHRTDLGTKVKSDVTLIRIRPDGTVHAPERPGLGFTLCPEALKRLQYIAGPEYAF